VRFYSWAVDGAIRLSRSSASLFGTAKKNESTVLPLRTAWLCFPGSCIRQQKCTFGAKFQSDVISFMLMNLTVDWIQLFVGDHNRDWTANPKSKNSTIRKKTKVVLYLAPENFLIQCLSGRIALNWHSRDLNFVARFVTQ